MSNDFKLPAIGPIRCLYSKEHGEVVQRSAFVAGLEHYGRLCAEAAFALSRRPAAATEGEFDVVAKLPDIHAKLREAYSEGACYEGGNGIDAQAYIVAEKIMREWDLPDYPLVPAEVAAEQPKLRHSEAYVADLEDSLKQVASLLDVKGGADDLIAVVKRLVAAEQPAALMDVVVIPRELVDTLLAALRTAQMFKLSTDLNAALEQHLSAAGQGKFGTSHMVLTGKPEREMEKNQAARALLDNPAGQGKDSRKKWRGVEEIQSWQERAGYAKDAPITPTGPIEKALAAELAEWKQYAALCDRALAARPSRVPEMMVVYPSEQGKGSERLDWMIHRGAHIAHTMDGEMCNVWLPARRDGTEARPAEGYPQKRYDDGRAAIDAAMKAGAQGGGKHG